MNNTKFKQGLSGSQKALTGFQKQVRALGGMIAGAFAVRAVVRFGQAALQALDVQRKAEAQLLTALDGRREAQEGLMEQARQLQKITLFGDEETIRAQALIAAFVKEESQIRRIIPLVQDLAAAKQMDLAGAADLVSKTLGSTTNALSRYGIQVEGAVGSTERLESLATGLTSAFGGQAEAMARADTTGTQLKNAVGDLKEEFGKMVNDLQASVLPALMDFVEVLNGSLETVRAIYRVKSFDPLAESVREVGKEVTLLTQRYKELNPQLSYAEAKEKAINALSIQYHKILGYAAPDELQKIEIIKAQIEELKRLRTALNEVKTATVEVNKTPPPVPTGGKDPGFGPVSHTYFSPIIPKDTIQKNMNDVVGIYRQGASEIGNISQNLAYDMGSILVSSFNDVGEAMGRALKGAKTDLSSLAMEILSNIGYMLVSAGFTVVQNSMGNTPMMMLGLAMIAQGGGMQLVSGITKGMMKPGGAGTTSSGGGSSHNISFEISGKNLVGVLNRNANYSGFA